MRNLLLVAIVACLQLTVSGVATAQSTGPRQDARATFESWEVGSQTLARREASVGGLTGLRPIRTRRVLIGGAIGAAAGVVACTAISTLADDSADRGLSFCPLDTYVLVGGAGFVAGAAIAWLF